MAEYQVRIYSNTGLNIENTLDNPTRLNSLAASNVLDVDPVYILTNQGLSSLIVSATKTQLSNADYLRIGNSSEGFEYYDIVRVGEPVTESTTVLYIKNDPLASIGGITRSDTTVSAGFMITDGVTDRVTVTDDTWGKYTEDDPLCAPQEPLKLETEWITPENTNNTGMTLSSLAIGVDPNAAIFCETSIDLVATYCSKHAKTYTTSVGDVTTPYVDNIAGGETSFGFESDPNIRISDGTKIYVKNQNFTYEGAGADIQTTIEAGISIARSLGIESAIFEQWAVPTGFLGLITYTNNIKNVTDPEEDEVSSVTNQRVSMIQGATGTLTSTLTPDYATVQNRRILYGRYNNYGIITCSGNKCEFMPEEVITADEFSNNSAPGITFNVDPRADGAPYYRFTTINGDTEFWRNALAGEKWARVPLVYSSGSGNELSRLTMVNSLQAQNTQAVASNVGGILSSAIGAISGLIGPGGTETNTSRDVISPYTGRAIMHNERTTTTTGTGSFNGSGISGVIGSATNLIGYRAGVKNALQSLYLDQSVYIPQVDFAYNASILRDLKGNGIMVYKYHMSDDDVTRIDKLLTMYGYKTTQPVTIDMFYRHAKFDYIAVDNLQVTGLPKWRAQDLADQLNGGVRIWHCLPSQNLSAYTDGSNTTL